jgi:hypothetical protein
MHCGTGTEQKKMGFLTVQAYLKIYLTFPCDRCDAAVGSLCVGTRGKPLKIQVHSVRRDRAKIYKRDHPKGYAGLRQRVEQEMHE